MDFCILKKEILEVESWPCDLGVPEIPRNDINRTFAYSAAAVLGKIVSALLFNT